MGLNYLVLSDAGRWAYCTASANTERKPADKAQSPEQAEGTAAHYTLERLLGDQSIGDKLKGTVAPNNHLINQEMIDHALKVIPEIKTMVDFLRFERKLTLVSEKGTRIFGKYDMGGGQQKTRTLRMMDYKYGFGIVEPFENMQLVGGAMGLLQELQADVFDWVELIVIQPRVNHPRGFIRKWRISMDEFIKWSSWLLHRADIAAAKSDVFTPGPWCKYCKRQRNCGALRNAGLHILDQLQNAALDDIAAGEIRYELELVTRNLKILTEHKKALEHQITHRAKAGEYLPGLMVEPAFGREVWTHPEQLETYEKAYLIDLHKRVPITPRQAVEAGMPEELVRTISKTPMTGHQIVKQDQIEKAKEIFNGPSKT